MPRVPQAHLEARQREILAAAHRRFAQQGFHVTTMQEVAEEAGLSVGALYRYFTGKEELIEALAAWGREQKSGALEALAPGGGAEALGRMVAEVLALLARPGSQAAVRLDVRLWGEALGQPALARVVAGGLEALLEPVATYVRRERKAGRLREDVDPDGVARAVVSLIAGLELQRAFDPDLEPARYAETVRLLLASLGR
ncbi:MAG TPA: TetR/AcrR family transcriptional regulator [Gemmatimonadota bacterium]|nr:TetR/AcrR family transcriptional regulator [Gemmatimonadota bacterium]